MKTAPAPANESARLRALESYAVLDTEPEAFFDQITTIAAEICRKPMALVSFVDGTRQWFKSRVGLGVTETPREFAFCAHAILEPEQLTIVPDARADARFADNPLVTGDPRIRFYAGAPIVDDDGQALGTLCVLDRETGALSPSQQRALAALSASVMSHLRSRRAARALADSLADKHAAERVLAAQQAVLQVLVESKKIGAAGDALAEAFGASLDLDASGLWLVDPRNTRQLVCRGAWSATAAAHPFVEASRGRTFLAGQGLPGRVYEHGVPTVISDIALDRNFPRAEAARASGLLSAFAIPVRGERGVIGALEVFSRTTSLPTTRLFGVLESLGRTIGMAIEREAAQAAVEAGSAELRAIIDSALDCIVTIDAHGCITAYNPAAERTFGWPAHEALGRDLGDLLVPKHLREAHHGGMNRYRLTGESRILGRRLEVPAVRADGTEFPVELTVLRLPGDGPPRFTAFLRDITERQQAQSAMADARKAAEESNRSKSEFLAVMSHEIRTPMNAIIGMTDLALEAAHSTDQRDLLVTVQSNAEHLLELVNEILDHSKLEAGQMELSLEPADLGAVAEGIVESLDSRAAEKGIELNCVVAPEIPDLLMIDRYRLRQVLMNLVVNAIKFTSAGAVDVAATIERADDAEVWVHLSVRDTGVGIPADALERIFAQFFQVDSSTTRAVGGTGLGLSISRALVTLMGGRIWAESEVGRGSVFHVVIPARRSGVSAPARRAADLPLPPGYAVVVVETAGPRAALLHALESRGLEVVGVASLAELRATRPPGDSRCRLAIVDQRIGGAAAESLLREWTGEDGIPPIIMLTASRIGRQEATLPGEHVLSRPLTDRRIGTVLARALGVAPARIPQPVTETVPQRLRILLVEDHEDNQRYVRRLLMNAGHHVDIAADGLEALERLDDCRYNLVFADVEMPRMDGIAFAHEARAREAASGDDRTPIVALSAHALLGFQEKCLAAGMNDHIAKPVKPKVLLDAVARHADARPVVVVADDADDSRDLLRRYLEGEGFRLAFARNGAEALRQFRRGHVAQLLLDMEMPVMNGYQTARSIRADEQGALVPIIAITGQEGPIEEARCREAGCTAFVSKPVRRESLRQVVRAQLGIGGAVGDPAAATSTPVVETGGDAERTAVPAEAADPGADSAAPLIRVDPDIADLIPDFLASRARDVADLREFMVAEDFAAIRRVGHNMKGSGRAYGFARLTEIGSALEEAGTSAALDVAQRLSADLDAYLRTVRWTTEGYVDD